ncbi:MAG: DUF4279 domain-containing protein [Cytophagales bacterium]
MYEDNYETCRETFVTFRIYFDEIHPEEITKILQIEPNNFQVKGEPFHDSKKSKALAKLNGWFLTSEELVNSKDSRRHLDYILDKILPVKEKIDNLVKKGATINLDCFWATEQGHGGPILSIEQINKLAEIGLEFSYDFYG